VKNTRPGIVLREFGLSWTKPTVAQAWGAWAWPMRLTASIIRAAPTSASRRRFIGVGPACAFLTGDGDLVPTLALGAGDGADRLLVVGPGQTLGEIEHAGEHPRADHRRRKARRFLVGPGDDLDWPLPSYSALQTRRLPGLQIPTKSPADSEMMSPGDTR
jgi:hypothetical protein